MHEVLTKRERGELPSLANVYKMLAEPWGADEKGGATGIAATIVDMTLSSFEPLRLQAGRFKSASTANRDIISTALNEISFLNSPPISRDVASSSNFRFSQMKDEIVTVYVILPATHLESHSNWLRLMIASALRELLATPAAPRKPPVLFMLDEFKQLGHLSLISNAMNIARSFGVQLWPFVQDLNQLRELYRDNWENFLGASAAMTAFAPRKDLFTMEYLSKLCGQKTVIVESENELHGSSNMGRGRQAQGVPLFRPEDLRAMPDGQMLCFVDPVTYPFMARAVGYWDTNYCEGLDENPYYPG
jgi:type IV secretion system protein VirD4